MPRSNISRANWSESRVRILLRLVIREKNHLHWNYSTKTLSKVGWSNVFPDFKRDTELAYNVQKLKDKLKGLKSHYYSWLKHQNQFGRRDKNTRRGKQRGQVNADDDEDHMAHPPCLDLLTEFFGTTPRDLGKLLLVGGVSNDPHLSYTPSYMSLRPRVGSTSGEQTSASPLESTGASPLESTAFNKRTTAIEDCANQIKDCIVRMESRIEARYGDDLDYMQVFHILREDGINEGSTWHSRALVLFQEKTELMEVFSCFETKTGRADWIRVAWEARHERLGLMNKK